MSLHYDINNYINNILTADSCIDDRSRFCGLVSKANRSLARGIFKCAKISTCHRDEHIYRKHYLPHTFKKNISNFAHIQFIICLLLRVSVLTIDSGVLAVSKTNAIVDVDFDFCIGYAKKKITNRIRMVFNFGKKKLVSAYPIVPTCVIISCIQPPTTEILYKYMEKIASSVEAYIDFERSIKAETDSIYRSEEQ